MKSNLILGALFCFLIECIKVKSLQPLARAFCTDLTVQGLGSQVKVFLSQRRVMYLHPHYIPVQIVKCTPNQIKPYHTQIIKSTAAISICLLPLAQSYISDLISNQHANFRKPPPNRGPKKANIRTNPKTALKCQRAAAQIDRCECTSEQLWKVNSLKRNPRPRQHDVQAATSFMCTFVLCRYSMIFRFMYT